MLTDDRRRPPGDADRTEIFSAALSPVSPLDRQQTKTTNTSAAGASRRGKAATTMKAKLKIGVASVAVAAATAVGVGVAAQADASGWNARATLRGADGSEIGQVTFEGNRRESEVRVKLEHLPPNWTTDAFHGFHIHANNTGTENGCIADPALSRRTGSCRLTATGRPRVRITRATTVTCAACSSMPTAAIRWRS